MAASNNIVFCWNLAISFFVARYNAITVNVRSAITEY